MIKVPLNKGMFALIDDEDWFKIWTFTWDFSTSGYAQTQRIKNKKKTAYFMHKLIMGNPSCKVDHIDHDKLNNQKFNLRLATSTQNNANRLPNTCKLTKGVTWDKSRSKWQAQIRVNGVQIYLGRYVDVNDAMRAYDAAASTYFGEFALTNKMLNLYVKEVVDV